MASPERGPKASRFLKLLLLNPPPSAPLVSTFTPLENCAPPAARTTKRLAAPQLVGVVVAWSPQTKHPSWSALAYCPAAKAAWPAVLGAEGLPVAVATPTTLKGQLPLAPSCAPARVESWQRQAFSSLRPAVAQRPAVSGAPRLGPPAAVAAAAVPAAGTGLPLTPAIRLGGGPPLDICGSMRKARLPFTRPSNE